MKILLVDPGSSYATHEVYSGLRDGLREHGHEVIEYRLTARLESLGRWITWQWKRAGKPEPAPTYADVAYQSSMPLLERALMTLPDWCVLVSVMNVHPRILQCLKRMGCPTAYVYTESPYDIDNEKFVSQWATACFINERSAIDDYRTANRHTYYLPHAYNPKIHYPGAPVSADVPHHDVIFVGTCWQERIDLLSRTDFQGIDFGLYGLWTMLGSRHPLRRYLRDTTPIKNERAVEYYRASAVGLNLYRTSVAFSRQPDHIPYAESLNPRALELAACGVFQVSDYRKEVNETFGPTVPTFRDPVELRAIIDRALGDPRWRRRMAEEARERVRDETYVHRARYLIDKLQLVAADRGVHAPDRTMAAAVSEVA